MLRDQQQNCQHYLHQAAFQDHLVMPVDNGKRE
jgi:hypothetical protein